MSEDVLRTETSASSVPGPIAVRSVDGNEREWQDYAVSHPGASLYHRMETWQVIERAFGHQRHYLMAMSAGAVRGILPLVEMKSRLFGHFLVSLPYFNYGGVLAEDEAAAAALLGEAAAIARRTGASHVELRQSSRLASAWHSREHKVAAVVRLEAGSHAYWNSLNSRMRGKIRKAKGSGALFEIPGAAGLADFYRVFCRNMRDLGTPVYSPKLFEETFRAFPENSLLFLVRLGATPVAGAIGLRSGSHMELPWICSDYGYSRANVNEFLYWSVLEWACDEGLTTVDLGRSSKGSGPHRFKMQWRPEEKPLHWYYWTAPGVDVPRLNPDNSKYGLAVRCWRKLPLPVANRLGPPIVKNIP